MILKRLFYYCLVAVMAALAIFGTPLPVPPRYPPPPRQDQTIAAEKQPD